MPQPESPAPLEMAAPDPALQRFNVLVDTWSLTGHTLDTPAADDITGWSTFAWLPGGHFLEIRGGIDFQGAQVESVEIIGYDAQTRSFTSHVYSNLSGDVLTYGWDVQGSTVTHWDADAIFTGTLTDGGRTLTGGWRPKPGRPIQAGSSYDVIMRKQ